MSLINCPECTREVSDAAKVCPNCGIRIKKIKMLRYSAIGMVGALILFAATGIAIGRLSSVAALNTIDQKTGITGSATITRYRDHPGGEEHYTCGIAEAGIKADGSKDYRRWYVVQRGAFRSVADAGIEGEKDFDDLYQIACGNY